jgi:hypothetical protein
MSATVITTATATERHGVERTMSLKVFHVFFVAVSTLMCFGVAGWNASAWTAGGSTSHLLQAIGWSAAAVALLVYGIRFIAKFRRLGSFVATALLLWANDALACSVCFGNPESPMTKSMVAGIWLMLGVIGTLLVGFAGVFLYWTYRSYHPELYRGEGATR